MLHLIWYIIVGLIAGFVAKSLMHTHLTFCGRSCSELSAQLLGAPSLIYFHRQAEEAGSIRRD